jgi:Protein of unknown function (DUF3303)
MIFMVIERFKDDDMLPIYKRVRDEGRMLPQGLEYIDSWVEPNFSRCFQLMECDDLRLLQQWILKWRGSGVSFEIVPVVSSKDTREVVAPHLGGPLVRIARPTSHARNSRAARGCGRGAGDRRPGPPRRRSSELRQSLRVRGLALPVIVETRVRRREEHS